LVGFLFFYIFINMKEQWEKTINKFLDLRDKELMDIYLSLRLMFMREGWSEKDLEKPPYYPQDIMKGFQKFSDEQSRLYFELKGFFNIDFNEFVYFIQPRLLKINEKTPLD
jgi:hypothetical protein